MVDIKIGRDRQGDDPNKALNWWDKSSSQKRLSETIIYDRRLLMVDCIAISGIIKKMKQQQVNNNVGDDDWGGSGFIIVINSRFVRGLRVAALIALTKSVQEGTVHSGLDHFLLSSPAGRYHCLSQF